MNQLKTMAGPVTLLDACFATQLVRYTTKQVDGHPLWTAQFLFADKELCTKIHREFIRAGSKIIRTNSYQASVPSFMEHMNIGQQDAIKIIKEAVTLAKKAISEEEESSGKRQNVQIAGSVGPYGACLHDGSEYTGSYCGKITKEELMEWHRPRIKALLDGGVDLLAFETIPCSIEAYALLQLLKEFPKAKAWLSFSIKNESQISNGEEFADVALACWELGSKQLLAIGANCVNPIYVTPLFSGLIKKNPSIPLVTYPNSGEVYDSELKQWVDKGNKRATDYIEEWLHLGISYIGGCCRTKPTELQEIAQKITKFQNKMM